MMMLSAATWPTALRSALAATSVLLLSQASSTSWTIARPRASSCDCARCSFSAFDHAAHSAEQSERASARQVLEISYDEAEEQKALQLQKQKTAPNVAAPSA